MYKSELIAKYGPEYNKEIEKSLVLPGGEIIVNKLEVPELVSLKLKMAKRFTRVYKENMGEPNAIIEAKCLAEQYPAICRNIVKGDLIAGRVHFYPLVGFGLEVTPHTGFVPAIQTDDVPGDKVSAEVKNIRDHIGSSNTGFYYDYPGLKKAIDILELDGDDKKEAEAILDFWWEESSRYKYNQAVPKEISDHIGRTDFNLNFASTFFRIGCTSVGVDPLLQRGIPGLKDYINEKSSQVESGSSAANMYEGMIMALDVLISVCRYYEKQALEMAGTEEDPDYKRELLIMADVLDKITVRKPETTREALQLFWLYNLLTGTLNYGRMDEYIGDFYVNDIDSKKYTDEDILKVLKSLYKEINDMQIDGLVNSMANQRIIVGGKGRRNPENADRFALIAMEASRQTYFEEPNVTLRFYEGQNPLLLEKAFDLISEGCIHPSLYNDDAYIPYVCEAYNVPLEDAESYIPQGCGEIVLDHRNIGSPNVIMNYLTTLDLVLHNGYYTNLGEQVGLKIGTLDSFDTYDKLLDAVKKQLSFTHDILAKRHAIEIDVEAKNIAHLFVSMMTDDCIAKGRTVMDEGARYLGGLIESFGITSLADSLYAIKKLVYDKKVLTLEKLVTILDADFEGYEKERQMMLNLPKFGNDLDCVDDIHSELTRFINEDCNEKGKAAGLDYFLICNLNPGGVSYAHNTKASADGRRYGDNMSVGNTPTPGKDKNGLTALLNSLKKHDKHHGGFCHNVKVSKQLLTGKNRSKFESVVKTYFDEGGIQLMVTALNIDDLKNAMETPEKYPNLLVRVGGWTARFVELEPVYQHEIIQRTMYQ